MNHRDFISKLGCMSSNVNILNMCFHTYKDFLSATSFSSSSTSTSSSSSSVISITSISKLILLSSSLFYLYVNVKTKLIKDDEDDNNYEDNINSKKIENIDNNDKVKTSNDNIKSHHLGLGLGLSDNKHHIIITDNNNNNDDDDDDDNIPHSLGLNAGLSHSENKKISNNTTSNIGKASSSRRQSVIGKSVIAKKDNEKTITPKKSENDTFFDELSTGISLNSPVTTYNVDREIKYENIYEEKDLNSSTSPLRKSKDDNDNSANIDDGSTSPLRKSKDDNDNSANTPPVSKQKVSPFPSPYDADDDQVTMMHVISDAWTLPIGVKIEMNREDAKSYFSHHQNKIDNPRFKLECQGLKRPHYTWAIERRLFDILKLELTINSEFSNIRDEIHKKGGKPLSQTELEQFHSDDLESSIQMYTKIISDYFFNVMSRKEVIKKTSTHSFLTDFFDPKASKDQSFIKPRDPLKPVKKA